MAGYVVRRGLQALPVLLVITAVSFALIHLVPGDPATIILGARATPESVTELRSQLGLDRSIASQYVEFLRGALVLDFGDSLSRRTSVSSVIAGRIGVSAWLLLYSVAIGVVIAVPLAVVSALRRNRPADHAIRLFSMVTFAMPAFWLGLVLILIFSLKLGWLPTSGYGRGAAEQVRSLTLPALTIGLYLAPLLLRPLRSSVIEALGADYIEAARARGLGETRVVVRHALRTSLVAAVTVLGLNMGFLLSGMVIVETVFALPGLGSELVTAIIARDFPVITALTLILGVAVVLINLLTDLSYALLDPRVRL